MSEPQIASTEEQAQPGTRDNIQKSEGWRTLYDSDEPECMSIKCTGGSLGLEDREIAIEVEKDGSTSKLGKGGQGKFKGKLVKVRALCRIASYETGSC